jgi:hypothetical protein
VPGVWTTIKIDVWGDRASLYVHDQAQPALIVNDVKSRVALRWGSIREPSLTFAT